MGSETMTKVILVASAAYSGSTMLDLMLSNANMGFSCGEISALFRPWRPYHLDPVCGCGNQDCEVWQRIRAFGERRVYEGVLAQFPDRAYLVDSSKDLAWLRDQQRYLAETDLEPRYVLLWKTPLEYAYSCWKRGSAKHWARRWASYYKRFLSFAPRWLSVSYRDLARRPAQTLKELCDALGIAYQVGKERFWERRQHSLWGSDTVKLHYLERASEEYTEAATRRARAKPNVDPAQATEIQHHRKIYYDDGYRRKLPAPMRKSASENADVTRLVALLQETDFRSSADPDKVEGLMQDLQPSPLWYLRDRAIDLVLELAARAGVRII